MSETVLKQCCNGQSLNISQNFLLTCKFHIRLHKIIICFDLDMDFLLDYNMVTAIVMINELIYLVKLYYCQARVPKTGLFLRDFRSVVRKLRSRSTSKKISQYASANTYSPDVARILDNSW